MADIANKHCAKSSQLHFDCSAACFNSISALNDVSDALFTIANISATAPVGGEKWKSGATKNITWTSVGVEKANLFYSTNNGVDWTPIASNVTASNGSYSWTVPGVTSSTCKIKIVDASDATLFKVTNTFSIWQPIVSTHTPSTGTITQNFDLTNIDFNAFILVADAITATFYPYESPQTGTLPSGVIGVSQYYWLITSASVSFFNGVTSVPLTSLTGVNDPTKLVWLKRTNSGDAWTNIGGSVSGGNLLSTVTFSSFSEFAIGSTGSDPLPVELEIFNAMVENSKVTLNWQTASEVNNYGFEIERKANDNWSKIGFVAGSGTTNAPREYSFVENNLPVGKHYYRLKQIDRDGKFECSQLVEATIVQTPKVFTLDLNYPNPFNPSTTLRYGLPIDSRVTLRIYNILGQQVSELVNSEQSAGWYRVSWQANVASGVYIYRLEAVSSSDPNHRFVDVKKMILMR